MRKYSVTLRVATPDSIYKSETYGFWIRARDHKRAERCARLLLRRWFGLTAEPLALVLK